MSLRQIENLTATTHVNTIESLPQISHHIQRQRRNLNLLHLAASGLLTGLLAFSGGLAAGALTDYSADQKLTFFMEVK